MAVNIGQVVQVESDNVRRVFAALFGLLYLLLSLGLLSSLSLLLSLIRLRGFGLFLGFRFLVSFHLLVDVG